jgi:hypothetical protein
MNPLIAFSAPRLQRPIAAMLIALLSTLALILPAKEVRAASGQFITRWVPWSVSPIASVTYPLDNFRQLGEVVPQRSGGFDIRMLAGERWITAGREEVGQLGLSSDVVSRLVTAFPGHTAIVFATYSPENAQLRIRIAKAERHPDGRIRSFLGDFTPHHGERWAAQRHYLSAAERTDTYRAGRNPFASFRPADDTDPVFYNIGWSAAQVAVGHAMRMYNASAAFIAMTDTRWTQTVTRSGNLFRQTVTTTHQAWVRPVWYVALPVDQAPYGTQAAICVLPGSTSCPSLELLAHSGVSIEEWQGGNMPSPEELLGAWTDSRSGFTVFTFALVTAALVWGAASIAAGAGQLGALQALPVGSILSPGTVAAFAGGAYAAGSTVFGGGGPVTSAQQGFLGATGSGFLEAPLAADPRAAELAGAIANRQVHGPLQQSISGTAGQFSGTCPVELSARDCRDASLDPGRIPRPDSVSQQNNVLQMRARSAECFAQGLRGAELARCAAPLAR